MRQVKENAIHKSNEGITSRDIAKMFGGGKTQIINILIDKATILEIQSLNEVTKSKNKLNFNQKYQEINGLLWEWY